MPQPRNQPSVEDVLRCLEEVSASNVSASVSAVHKQLEELDPSDDNYRSLLRELLGHQDLKPHIQALRGSSLEGFIELLDKVGEADIDIHQC